MRCHAALQHNTCLEEMSRQISDLSPVHVQEDRSLAKIGD